jgi:hypothetical protein
MGLGVCLALTGALSAGAQTVYYVNDDSTTGDIYTTIEGNDGNSGTASNAPKRTLSSVLTNAMAPGDVIYIDTGSYTNNELISAVVNGVEGNPIRIQGSSNLAAGGTTLTANSGNVLEIRGNYLDLRDFRTIGGTYGIALNNASYNEFLRVHCISNTLRGLISSGQDNSNKFRHCIFYAVTWSGLEYQSASSTGNYIENCVLGSVNNIPIYPKPNSFSNIVNSVFIAPRMFSSSGNIPEVMEHNLFSYTTIFASEQETMEDVRRDRPGWTGNTVADPRVVNVSALDFHLLSMAGHATNGNTAVTNIAAVHSPLIDFGRLGDAVGDEPAPNGGRVNAGLYGGTAEASKSRSDDWLFAMTFNDGGNLIQTARLEWVAGNLGAGATVNLEYSTNNGTGWSTITNGLAATNEAYTWVPAFAHAAVLWRVVNATNAACVSTNAKPFSVRPATNTAFSFYVNDGITADDVYCSAAGSPSNLGVATNAPKASLMGIVTNYSLRGGDIIYVDTGTYAGQTVVIGGFDSGRAGSPVRILGSSNGSILDRMSAATVLDISGASFLEIENLDLTGGSAGLYGSGASDITLRNVQFRDNQTGVSLAGAAVRHVFERCLAANNSSHAFLSSSTAVRSNQWLNGVMWNSPTIIHAATNQALTVSNSILGQAGTALFGNQAVAGNYNVVWGLPPTNGVGGGFAKFTALQSSTLGWDRCAYADPLFANAAGGDYHLKSEAGRYNPGTGLPDLVDGEHSPAIDLGDPAADVTGIEPDPNGGRLNAGLYGGTAQASLSRTNAWLQLLTYMDGAPLSATDGAWVRWDGGQYETNATVRILLSRDSGLTWEVLETNVTAETGSYWYQELEADNTSSMSGRLRVELEDHPEAGSGTGSESPMDFIYRNGSFAYYINDASTVGDVYCGAPGSDENVGTSSNLPMANLHALVAKFITFGPGDRIFIDTGSYTATNPVVMGPAQSGTPSEPIVIEGSTNRLAGGTVFGASGTARPMGFEFQSGASNLVLRDIIVTNRQTGISMGTVSNLLLHRVEVRGGTSRAFDLNGSRHVTLSNCVAHGGGVGVYLSNARAIAIRHGVFWENSPAIQRAAGTDELEVRSSILGSTRTGGTLYSLNSASGFTSDYNGLYAGPNTRVGTLGGTAADNVAAWRTLTGGQDGHSVPGEPRMANPGAATADEFAYDYHLKTEETLGRLRRDGTRRNDTTSSPLLDAGDPEDKPGEEPEPNRGAGQHRCMGRDGRGQQGAGHRALASDGVVRGWRQRVYGRGPPGLDGRRRVQQPDGNGGGVGGWRRKLGVSAGGHQRADHQRVGGLDGCRSSGHAWRGLAGGV